MMVVVSSLVVSVIIVAIISILFMIHFGLVIYHHMFIIIHVVHLFVIILDRLFNRIKLLEILFHLQVGIEVNQSRPDHTDHVHLVQEQCVQLNNVLLNVRTWFVHLVQ